MSKSLADLCMFCIAKNLQNINRVGAFLSKNDNEVLLELLCDHDMLTASNLPHITYQLLTSRLENIAFRYSRQVNDTLLQNVAQSGCRLKFFILKDCPQVSGEFNSLDQNHYTTKVLPTLKIFCPRNQLLIMLFARLHNLFCSFQKPTALHLGIGPLLMLHLFYGTRCH